MDFYKHLPGKTQKKFAVRLAIWSLCVYIMNMYCKVEP